MIICISLLWIYNLNMDNVNWSMPHHLQVVWLSNFTGDLDLSNNELTGTLPTEMGNLTQFGKLLCTHCLNSFMDFVFCMIICISLLWIYDLNMESWDNVYIITYQVESDFPFQWEVCPLVCYLTDTAGLWNEKVTRLASGEIFWSINTLHIQIIYS